jgi:RecA/RadA recombinase
MITFTGDSFGSTDRILTACHSLDLALQDRKGNTGYPLKSLSEVYGNKGVGKSTFCFSLMGMIASKLQKNIVILDWEGQSRETIEGVLERQNFMGSV